MGPKLIFLASVLCSGVKHEHKCEKYLQKCAATDPSFRYAAHCKEDFLNRIPLPHHLRHHRRKHHHKHKHHHHHPRHHKEEPTTVVEEIKK